MTDPSDIQAQRLALVQHLTFTHRGRPRGQVEPLSWPAMPSAQVSAGEPEEPTGVTHPERQVFERMCAFGQQMHMEIRTTASSPDRDPGFWLSENQRIQAAQDCRWRVYRVWSIHTSPCCSDLGNILRQPDDLWQLDPSTLRVTHNGGMDSAEA
jgi:hypothetical protein